MEMKTPPGVYVTTDLNVAAFLMARGHGLSRIEKLPDGRRSTFVFDSGAEDAERFFQGEVVNARAFARALKQLKAAIHAL